MTSLRNLVRHDSTRTDHDVQPAVRENSAPLDDAIERVDNALGQAMQEGDVFIISGANSQPFPVATRTVGETRAMLQYIMNIGPEAVALLNGRPVVPDQVLQQGDTLEFTKEGGEKGGRLSC